MISTLSDLSINTKRLHIRPLEVADLKQIYSIHCDPEVNQHLPYDTWLNWDDAESWYATTLERRKDRVAEQFTIELNSDRRLVGTCIAFNYNCHKCKLEIGYVLARHAWKRGYMREAMSAFTVYLEQQCGLRIIEANVENDNTASLSLLAKLGFTIIDTTVEDDGVYLHRLQRCF